ncbi:hypothetical protein M3J09_013749 [Ascochyta lentis]
MRAERNLLRTGGLGLVGPPTPNFSHLARHLASLVWHVPTTSSIAATIDSGVCWYPRKDIGCRCPT